MDVVANHYHKIDTCNMVNGTGVRTVIWMSGCGHHCEGCFNPTTWHRMGGKAYDVKAHYEFVNGVADEFCDGCTLTGGDPLMPYNRNMSLALAKQVKEMGKTVWCYTGFEYEYVKDWDVMEYIDVLVTGRFEIDKYNPTLKWRGSANQLIIDVQQSRKLGKVVLHPDNNEVDKYYPEQAFNPCEGMTKQEIKEKYIDNPCTGEGLN